MSILFDKINILLLVTALLNLFLGFIIFFNGRNKKINIVYTLNIVTIISWVLGMVLYRSAPLETSLFWCTVLYIAPTLIASSFLYFTYIFPMKIDSNVTLKSVIIFSINTIIIIMLAWPGLVIKAVNINPGFEKEIIFTKFYWFYFLYIAGFFSYGFQRLFLRYLKSSGIERLQIIYFLLGYAIASNLAFVTNLIMPWIGYFFLNWLGQVFTVTMVGFTTYAILRYRLMDIRIVARKLFIYIGIAGFAYGIFYFLIWFYNHAFGSVFSSAAYVTGLVVAPFFVLAFYSLDRYLKIFANKYLFVSLYNYQDTISKLTDKLNYYIDLDEIIGLIVDTIKKTMQLDRAGVLLVNSQTDPIKYQIAKVIGFNRQNGISLVQDNFLTKYLSKTQKPLVRDELNFLVRNFKTVEEKQNFEKLYDHMKHIEASICLPLMSNQKLIGIVVLGSKISGDAYSKEDLELLNTLANQAGIAVDNARLYKEVQDFSQTLKQKVNEQTKEIKTQSKDIEEKNKYLQELLNMKTDFLRVVNHQLNTPLAVMKGYFSMMEEGSYPKEKAMKSVKGGLERISSTVSDFWDAYELEGERMNMEPQKTDITEIVNRLIPEKQKLQLAQERNLEVSVKKPNFKIPLVWCDYKKTAHVISNLLDNAVYYTRKGAVTLSYEMAGKDYLKINIKDTGVGISEEGKKKLFQKFSRGQNATDLRPDGSGLGLFIAKKIVEGNNGEISCFSEGIGKGSTFSFTIPIYKNQQTAIGQEKPVTREKKIVIFDQD